MLKRFYAEVKNKHGEDYEPDSLKVMLTALDRHFKDKGYKLSIIRDREFSSSKQVLEGKAQQLRKAGLGKRPNKARQVSAEEEKTLWKTGKFCQQSPEALIQTMWWLLTQHFGLRGRQEHHGMRLDDFRILEGPTKTRQAGLNAKSRSFQPKMFLTGGERCPVALFREFIRRRPSTVQQSGPFYLAIKTNRHGDDETWYKAQPKGVNKINSMMKCIIAGTSLETSEKRFSNHSARKTVVNKMKKASLERSAIAKVTGHRNIQSLDDYEEADEVERRSLSWAISGRNNQGGETSASMSVSSTKFSQLPSSPSRNMKNCFSNCNVTFNVYNRNHKTSPVINPLKRQLDCDSDTDY